MPPMCSGTHEEPQEKRKECHPCSHKTPSTLTIPKAALHTYMKILNHALMHPSYNKSLTLTIAIQHKASRRRQALKELKARHKSGFQLGLEGMKTPLTMLSIYR